jgi:hypothetical protein
MDRLMNISLIICAVGVIGVFISFTHWIIKG